MTAALRTAGAVARAELLARVRHEGFLLTLGLAAFVAWLGATGQVTLNIADFRGVMNAAWIGTLMAYTAGVFLSLVAFYIVRGGVERDRATGVGQLLAASPLGRVPYLLGKYLASLGLLATMLAVLLAAGLATLLGAAEDRTLHLGALVMPYIVIGLPPLALAAGFAVLTETLRPLRGALGNVLWIFAWTPFLMFAIFGAGDIMAFQAVRASFRALLPDGGAHASENFALQIGGLSEKVLPTVRWAGVDWTAGHLVTALVVVLAGALIAVAGAPLFDRFAREDQARGSARKAEPAKEVAASPSPARLASLPAIAVRPSFVRLAIADLRLTLAGRSIYWWVVFLGLAIVSAAVTAGNATASVRAAALLWPLPLWSALGSRERRYNTAPYMLAAPRPTLQLAASWISGFVLFVLAAAPGALRAQTPLALAAGAIFVPSLALACGTWSGGTKLFEAIYLLLWYVGPVNAIAPVDFSGGAAGAYATPFAIAAAALTAAAVVRHRRTE